MAVSPTNEGTPAGQGGRGFWRKLGHEIQPIVIHAVVVLILEFSFLLIGLMTLKLEKTFPNQEKYINIIKIVDIWIFLGILGQFGLYTFVQVGIRLFHGLKEAWHNR